MELITLLVGLFVFVIYLLQRHSRIREAAGILLMEIRQAEKAVEILSKNINIETPVIVLIFRGNN
jgi:hypothetical protein